MAQAIKYVTLLGMGALLAIAFGSDAGLPAMKLLLHAGASGLESASAISIDPLSMGIGAVLGALSWQLATLNWTHMPRQAAAWLWAHAGDFVYVALTAVLLSVLIYY